MSEEEQLLRALAEGFAQRHQPLLLYVGPDVLRVEWRGQVWLVRAERESSDE